ncbi:CheA signal transduction histidine kinase [gamma proteobacterium HTCC5015]|nr:CheA signal transduction histidine kinase [gamma proteobacterium HTCC5015]
MVSNRGAKDQGRDSGEVSDSAAENLKVLSTVVKEAQKDMLKAKEAIIDYLGDASKIDKLQQVPELLASISGAMFVEQLQPIKPLIETLSNYLNNQVLKTATPPPEQEQEAIADLVTSIEYFMEAAGENRDDGSLYIAVGEEAIERLGGAQPEVISVAGIEDADELDSEPVANEGDEPVADLELDDALSLESEESDSTELAGADGESQPEPRESVAPAPVAKSEPFERNLDIISEDVDEEILEIFIEEALEELERISELFPRWRQSPDDSEAITTIRRSFHTLKGSGRLVGAQLIGEFGWAVENMLNRLLDETISLSDGLYNVVEDTVGILPQLVEQLTGNKEPIEEAYDLMARAWLVADGKDPSAAAEAVETEQAVEDASPQEASADESVTEEEAMPEPSAEGQESADIDLSGVALSEDDSPSDEEGEGLLDLDEDLTNMAIESSDVDEGADQEEGINAASLDSEGASDDIEFDWSEDLEELSASDSEGSSDEGEIDLDFTELDAVEDEADEEDDESDGPSFALSEEDMGDEAEATPNADIELDDMLFGEELPQSSAGTAGASELVSDLESVFPEESEVDLSSEQLATDEEGEIDLPLAGSDEPEGEWDLPEMDPVLVDIYSAETMQHVETIENLLGALESDDQLENSHDLTRALHTIHGSSRTAEMHAVADVARRLEYHGNDQEELGEPWPAASVGLLREATVATRKALECLSDPGAKKPDLVGLLSRIDPLAQESKARVEANERGQPDPFDEGAAASQQDEDQAPAEPEEELAAAAPTFDTEEETIRVDTDDELVDIFLEECEELIDECDNTLQQCEESGFQEEQIAALQRQMHTLKGGARMAELTPMGDLSHALEEAVLGIQQGEVEATEVVTSTLRQAGDQLAAMMQEVQERGQLTSARALVSRLERIRQGEAPAATEQTDAPSESPAVSAVAEVELGDEAEPREVAAAEESGAALEDDSVESGEGAEANSSADKIAVDVNDDLVEIFLEEGEDLVQACDNLLHEWEGNDFDKAQAEELQRQLHTLKGGARMAGLTPIGDLSHAMEELILSVEKEKIEMDDSTMEVLKSVADELTDMLASIRKHGYVVSAQQWVDRLNKLGAGEALDDGGEPLAEEPAPTAEITEAQDKPSLPAEGQSDQPEDPVAKVIDPNDANAKRFAETAAPAAMTGATAEQIRVRADRLDSLVNSAGEVSVYHSRLQQQLGGFGFNLGELNQTVDRIREQVRQVSIETDAQIDSRYAREQENPYDDFDPLEMDRYSHMQQLSRSLMESVHDLEDLRDTMSNMVRDSETLLHQQQRVSTDLQEGLMGTRMVRFDGVTSRLRRIVRQTAQQLDKKAQIEFEGVDNEVDRSVQERMLAPLEHMLRNAVSHGIEAPQERAAKGKSEQGHINLHIGRDGSFIVLTLSDDGAGIDVNRIREKAIERGLMEKGQEVPDQEVMQYILHTGFSTADQVTQISGRGVGMDVVNSEIKHLGGSLRIESELGHGTTFLVRLPLTLAINQALLVLAGEDTYAIPLTAIEGVARVGGQALSEQYDSDVPQYRYAGEDYDIFYLPSLLKQGVPGELDDEEQYPLLLVRAGERRVAIHADEMLGRREIVVKPVGRQVSTLPGVSGATILDDGRVALILEISGLVQGDVVMMSLTEDIDEPDSQAQEKKKTVMVVDDSITIRKVSARFLERNNYEVVTAKDGMDAVAQLQEVRPDVMLLDIEMPRMDGYEVATHVRATQEIEDLPIIMITSRTGDKHRERAMQIGVNRYLGKPFQEAELLEEITNLLGE